MRLYTLLFLVTLLSFSSTSLSAQTDCGVVDGIGFPVNTGTFSLAQDFAIASERHQGRYHTGEDWHGGRDNSVGQAVQAAARGRVSYSSVNGWGRDGGVVILEHTFPDGTVYYTLYGHITESESFQFPPRLTCVQQGDVIGVVADVRPAPHLHFEVRVSGGTNGAIPGAGYSINTPYEDGLRNPTKFITNQQTWLSLWHDWHLMIGTETDSDERAPITPPISLNDNSLLYLDGTGQTLRRATPDGRVLWRIRLDTAAVALEAWRGSSLLTLGDGTQHLIDVETGSLGETWRVAAEFTGTPLIAGDELLFPSDNNSMVRLSADRREILARYLDIPAFYRAHVLPDGTFALLGNDNQFYYYSADGNLINTAQLRAAASFATSWDARLLVYTQGGLWHVNEVGNWSLYIEDAPAGGNQASILTTQDRLYLYTGDRLLAYDRELARLWQATTPPTLGLSAITTYENILLITSNHGDVLLVNETGAFCNQVRVYGQAGANQWNSLGADNRLRIAIADQILALEWDTFTRPCNS
ncbi:MAG: peptidoglycan DD-metalloendopeptidase family protein [Phototrophicaceae bacterium]